MKLRKTELAALAVTLLFAALAVGWHVGQGRRVPAFRVSTGTETSVQARVLPPETAEGPAAAAPVNLNTADAEELKTLAGVGDVLAERIIAYREEHGPFRRVEDITLVSGIGPKICSENLGRMTVGEDTA